MTLKTAKQSFEAALEIAKDENDAYRELIAQGLLDLTHALQLKISDIDSRVKEIKSKI